MKKLILGVAILVLVGILFIVSNHANNIEKETYVSRVIIDVPWGKEPGQFGIYDPLEHGEGGPIVGPSTFTVSSHDELYLLDLLNGRVQKFSEDGGLVSVTNLPMVDLKMDIDQSGNIYIYDTGRVPRRIIQYSNEGDLVKEYPILWEDKGMRGGDIRCDKLGRIFLSYRSDSLRTPMIFEVGTTAMVFSAEQQKATLKEGFVGSNSVVLDQGAVFQTKTGELEMVGDSARTVKKFNAYRMNFGQAGFTGVDNQMNIYTTSGNTIRKYGPAGDLIAEIAIQKEDYIWTSKSLYLDEHGNVYVMSTSKDGLKIIKWSPVGVK